MFFSAVAVAICLAGFGATAASAAPSGPDAPASISAVSPDQWVFTGFYESWLACQEDGIEGTIFTAADDYRCDTVHNPNGSTKGWNLFLHFP